MTRTERKAQIARSQAVHDAVTDEMARMNAAVRNGTVVKVHTFNGDFNLKYVRDFDYHTDGNGGFGQTWAGCNDGQWADMMRQAGLDRNRLFQ